MNILTTQVCITRRPHYSRCTCRLFQNVARKSRLGTPCNKRFYRDLNMCDVKKFNMQMYDKNKKQKVHSFSGASWKGIEY